MKPIDSSALALLDLRCPRCHQGKLFSYPAYNLTKYAVMPERCPVCGEPSERHLPPPAQQNRQRPNS